MTFLLVSFSYLSESFTCSSMRTEKNEIEDLNPFLKSLNWEIALPI